MVPIRHTSQVLTGLIDEAHEQLYLVSFVALPRRKCDFRLAAGDRTWRAGPRACRTVQGTRWQRDRRFRCDAEEKSPAVQFFEWEKGSGDTAQGASVHAKCAVADGNIAFVTSANLSDAAMERNMELGVLLRGGQVPRLLDQHLTALVTTKQIRPL